MNGTVAAVGPGVEELAERLSRLEARLTELEAWRAASGPAPAERGAPAREREVPSLEAEPAEEAGGGFDLALLGRTLIVLGGAFMLRAASDSGAIPVVAGVALGLVYAALFALFAMRQSVSATSATFHGYAALLVAFPLVWEATRKFSIFGSWSAAGVLGAMTALLLVLAWRRRLNVLAWGVALFALALAPMLMLFTASAAPFVLYLLALGVATLWMGYELDWHLMRWPVALELDVAVLAIGFLVATGRNATMPAWGGIALGFGVFAVYLLAFAWRTVSMRRNIVPFEVVQGIGAFGCGVGAAVWIARSLGSGETALATAALVLAIGCYALSFAFLTRLAGSSNFSYFSSLALVLTLTAGSLMVHGTASSVLWSVLAAAAAWAASRYGRTSLAFHAGVFVLAGLVSSELLALGMRAVFLPPPTPWPAPGIAAIVTAAACFYAVWLRPIEHARSYEPWSWAKLILMTEAGWVTATLAMSVLGIALGGAQAPVVAVTRTAVLSLLTVGAAWVARWPRFSPGRWIASGMIVVLIMKLIWDDFRNGRAATLFVSLAIVGIALILAPRLGKKANAPMGERELEGGC